MATYSGKTRSNGPGRNADRHSLPEGAIIGSYRIVRTLGRGGFGITYLAQHMGLNREVALKEMLPMDFATRAEDGSVVPTSEESAGDLKWALERFLEEARTLARCEHPNVLKVFDVFAANGTAYISTGYEQGCTLEQWLNNLARPPTEAEVLAVLTPLLSGLSRVHAIGLLHRDIKPDNVYMCADGRPVLLDFGAARAAIGNRTHTVTTLVTPGYAPVEQYSSEEAGNAGPECDLYALGATIHRMLARQKPPEAPGRVGRRDPYQSLVQRLKGRYSQRLLSTVDACLAVMAEDRPQSSEAVREMLLGSQATHKTEKTERAVKTKATGLGAWLAVGGGAVAVGALVLIASQRPQKVQESPEKPKIAKAVPAAPVPAPAPKPVAPPPPTPSTATKDAPFVNSLGMKFVPVPIQGGPTSGKRILFSVYETTKGDYRAFALDKGSTLAGDYWLKTSYEGDTPEDAMPVSVSPGDDFPVVGVTHAQATDFCLWLTQKEAQKGIYRLPTDHEWSCAVGIGDKENAMESPEKKSGALDHVYPWGLTWPPEKKVGNLADVSFATTMIHNTQNFNIAREPDVCASLNSNYDDGWATTSPVGKFSPNSLGLFDMAGNVSERCSDQVNEYHVLRGSNWLEIFYHHVVEEQRHDFLSSARRCRDDFLKMRNGFRCVLEVMDVGGSSSSRTAP